MHRSFDIDPSESQPKIGNLFVFEESEVEMEWSTVIIALLVLAGAVSLLIEVIYFIRVGLCYILARFFKRKVHILEKCSLTGEF